MANSLRLVKVFLASPGDLSNERRSAKFVVDEFNDLLAEEFGYQVDLVGWEDTVSVFGRPQATINRELERCELFVGLMWKHWGTPPDVTGPYTSGFEEEYRTSVARRLKDGQPEITLLFKEIDQEFLNDPGDELKKVLEFKKQLVTEKKILFENFSDIREFEKKFRRSITSYIRSLRARECEEASDQSQAPTMGGEERKAVESTGSAPETPLSVEGAKFLREFISKTERTAGQTPVTTVEIARFRLLASLVGHQGNDERSLGVHDANILFSKRSDIEFGNREMYGLLASGLEHYSNENTPLWHWVAAIDGFTEHTLPFYSIIGSGKKRVGTLEAMRLISEPLFLESPFEDRKDYFDSWFADDAEKDLRIAALGYLSDCGIAADLMTIRQEFDKNDSQTVKAAVEAIIRINLRDSRERAILALFELQPTSIDKNIIATLFDNEAALGTDLLLQGVSHQNSDVRRTVIELLHKRRALTIEMAEQLMTDSEASIRYEALSTLIDAGRTLSNDEAKKILVKQTRNSGFGILGISDDAGETCWKQFRQEQLRSMKDKELEEVAREDSIFDRDAQFIFSERHFKRYGEALRKAVDDQYKNMFSQALHAMVEKYGAQGAKLVKDTRSLDEYIRKDLTRQGLNVICRQADPSDLGRVRAAMKSGFVDYSDADIKYLQRFGEWEDIPLIIDSIGRPEYGRRSLLLSAFSDQKDRVAARAIYTLGRARLPEVLVMSMPSRLLSHLVIETSDKAFRGLCDESIVLLLRSQNDAVRKAAALKCVRALPKSRVSVLLAEYVSGDKYRYYNVVHWLDFGVSVPRDRVLLAAEKVIDKEWRS